ncbi:hypothetical protein D0Y65_005455, partial [Glycine soja]
LQTSVLSKWWRYIWTSLPILNFHSSSFNNDSLLFRSFVYHFLSRRDASTNVYHLNFKCQDKKLDLAKTIDSIIDYVTLTPPISAAIQVLSILAPPNNTIVGNFSQLSHCQSLTTLNLSDISTDITSFRLVSLQKLDLYDCVFECGLEEFLNPFRGCVNLTTLSLFGLHIDVLGCTNDPNLQLKLIQMFEVMGSAEFVALSTGIVEVLSMFPDLLDSRPSPFTKVQTFELNREIPASSVDMPANVMAYLFGKSPGFDFYECRWEGAKWSKQSD